MDWRSSLEVFDLASAQVRTVLRTPMLIEAPNWHPDGWFLVNGEGRLWRAGEGGLEPIVTGHEERCNNDHGFLPDGRMLVNTSGCSALSKGGSGDVLTGLIASLLCQGMGAAEAAALGVWLHGRAGELLAQEMTAYCASPRELVTRGLGLAFRELLEA